MLPRLLARTGVLVASLLAASLLVFLALQLLPGDPARVALGTNATPENVERLRAQLGLDRPWPVRYVDWLGGLVTLRLGESPVSGAAIGPQLLDRLGVTLWLVVLSMLLAVAVAVPLGAAMALHHRRALGTVLSALSQVGMAVPAFLVGMLLVAFVSVRQGWLPASGWVPPAQGLGEFARHIVLPVVSLAGVQAAVLSRYVRAAVLEVADDDYLRTARSKGLRPTQALVRHGWRNAAIPVITVLGLQLATLLVGAVVIEQVFVLPGLGSLLVDAVASRDLLVVQDVVMVLVAAVLLVSFVVDVLYVLVDPRLRA